MKLIFSLILLLLSMLVGCGRDKETTLPDAKSPNLEQQIARITPQLLWCDGQATPPRKNNIDGRPNCDLGDAMSESGRLLLDGGVNWQSTLWPAMKASISVTGQPWRTPSYVEKEQKDEFSRDQLMGLIEGVIATGETEPLKKVLAYAKANGNKLCPHPTDNRCDLTKGMENMASYALKETLSGAEIAADETTINGEAATVPLTFQAYLVFRKLMIIMRTNNLTEGYAHAAMVLHKRMPKNLFAQTVYFMSHNGTNKDFDSIAEKLAKCMATWEKPGLHWLWSQGNVECMDNVRGHELVAHARFLLALKNNEIAYK